jgi:xanthine dehydrogenase accessory factor
VIAVVIDPKCQIAQSLQPTIIIDARMLRRSITTRIDEAPVVIGLGPGFVVGEHAHAVIETNRGHDLGRVLYEGMAEPSTGVPGPIGDHTNNRVLRTPATGPFEPVRDIGDHVGPGDVVASVAGQPIVAAISGAIRGLIHEGVHVKAGIKVGDIDPRGVREYCFTISDKANAVAGGVVEACCWLLRDRHLWPLG